MKRIGSKLTFSVDFIREAAIWLVARRTGQNSKIQGLHTIIVVGRKAGGEDESKKDVSMSSHGDNRDDAMTSQVPFSIYWRGWNFDFRRFESLQRLKVTSGDHRTYVH